MSGDMIRVGVIGAGGNTREKHIPGLQAIEGVRVVCVCNRSDQSSRRVAGEFGIPRVHEHWTDVIDDAQTDAIVIGTWPYLHCLATLAALQADKHVMCEARMAMDAEEARLMWEAARERPHLVAQVVPSPMTLGVDETIKRLVAEGYLGDLLAVEVRGGGEFIDRAAALTWRQDADLSGVNTMALGIWYEAVMRWVGEATRVVARGRTFAPMRSDGSGRLRAVRVPDHLDLIADMACGAQLHMQISGVTGHAGPAEAILFGSEGTLCFREGKLLGGRRDDGELCEIPPAPDESGGWRVEAEFIGAIRGEEPIRLTDFSTGLKYMEFTQAVMESSRTGCAVDLPL